MARTFPHFGSHVSDFAHHCVVHGTAVWCRACHCIWRSSAGLQASVAVAVAYAAADPSTDCNKAWFVTAVITYLGDATGHFSSGSHPVLDTNTAWLLQSCKANGPHGGFKASRRPAIAL